MYGNKAYLLIDTDVIINYLRGCNEEAEIFHRVVIDQEFYGCYSSITEVELFAVDRMTQEQEEDIKKLLGQLQRIDVSIPIAQLAGKMLARYRKSRGLEMPDAIIAASAIVHRVSLVSKNTKHYHFIEGLVLSPPSVYS